MIAPPSMNYERRPPQEDVDAAASYGLDFIDFTNPFGLFRTDHVTADAESTNSTPSSNGGQRSSD